MLKLLLLFWTFFKVGLFTFGGGYAMINLIIEETSKYFDLNYNDLIDFIGISESTPGPFAINIATFIGYSQGGILGAILSTLGVILPSFIIILVLFKIIEKIKDNRYFKTVISCVMPIVIGLIISTICSLSLNSILNVNNIYKIKEELNLNLIPLISLLIMTSLIIILKKKKITLSPIKIILTCAILGIIICPLA